MYFILSRLNFHPILPHMVRRSKKIVHCGIPSETRWDPHAYCLAHAQRQSVDPINFQLAIGPAGEVFRSGAERAVRPQFTTIAFARALTAEAILHDIIGGAQMAAELDALRAIDQGMPVAYRL
jgi:hypothetical protein